MVIQVRILLEWLEGAWRERGVWTLQSAVRELDDFHEWCFPQRKTKLGWQGYFIISWMDNKGQGRDACNNPSLSHP
jgi:hypothetical protein